MSRSGVVSSAGSRCVSGVTRCLKRRRTLCIGKYMQLILKVSMIHDQDLTQSSKKHGIHWAGSGSTQ